jgi:ER membrane protein complex subunit 1
VALTTSSTTVYYVALAPTRLKGYQIKVTSVDPNSARPGSQHVLDSENEVNSPDSILYIGSQSAAPVIAWSDKSFKVLKINVLGKKGITTINVEKHGEEDIKRISVLAPNVGKALAHFIVSYHTEKSHWAEVYHIDLIKGTIAKAYDLPKLGGPGAFSVSTIDANVYFTRHGAQEISLVSSTSHGILEKWPLIFKGVVDVPNPAPIAHAISEVVSKGPSNFAIRSVLTLTSGDVELVQNGVHTWIRSESLSGITRAAWAELPQPEDLAKALESESHSNFVSAYIHRVVRHVGDLKYLPGWLQNIPKRVLSSFIATEPTAIITTDTFGFRKLIIVATDSGRVAAIDSGSQGQILWNIQAVELEKGTVWDITDIPVQEGMAWLISKDPKKSIVVDLNGKIQSNYKFDSVLPGHQVVPAMGRTKSSLITVSPDGIPDSKPLEGVENNTNVITRKADGSLVGWTIKPGKNKKPVKVWDFVAPHGYTLDLVSSRPGHDPVASIGRALGDRNVLYKFLSPNLLLLGCLNPTSSSALVILLDSVSGQILHTTEHNAIDITKGISATLSENWFAYVLQSDPALAKPEIGPLTPKSSLLIISELFESSIPNDRGPLGPSSNMSSLDSVYSPHVVTASYVIPTTLQHLATTSTKQGITPRSILAYSPSLAALLAIPISVLSPRRPVGRDPTPSEREEGLFRYSPLLDFDPRWTLSHKREVLGIKGIISTPTDMESTSLVFSYGDLDIFGTRVSPIGTFDMLGKGFGKVQLILTVAALAVGTGILAPMVSLFSCTTAIM